MTEKYSYLNFAHMRPIQNEKLDDLSINVKKELTFLCTMSTLTSTFLKQRNSIRRQIETYFLFVAVQVELAKFGRHEGNIVILAAFPASQNCSCHKGSRAELLSSLFVWDPQEEATQCGTMCQMGGPQRGTPRNHQVRWFERQQGCVLGGGVALVYIEIKAEKWETGVYISDGLFSLFPSTPKHKQRQGVLKNAAFQRPWKCETEPRPALIYKSRLQVWQSHICNMMYIQYSLKVLQYTNVTVVASIYFFYCKCSQVQFWSWCCRYVWFPSA